MSSLILNDAQAAPRVFLWNGPVDHEEIKQWIARRGWVIPPDLLELWTITGGGEIFESERILRPLISRDGQEEVAQVTSWCQERGLPSGLVVFHEGLGFTAVRCSHGAYVSLDSRFSVTGEYESLDGWYAEVLRAEYGPRYGLSSAG
jgi:hypothetical protein